MIRRDALVAALAERGRAAPIVHRAADVDAEGLRAVAAKIRAGRADVVVCYDDKTALLLMDELRSAGVHVPADVGIVGFDDIPFARIANPRLTTVSQQSDDLGRISVDFLLSTLQKGTLPRSQQMPVALVVRETTPGPAKKSLKPPNSHKKGQRS